MSAVPAGPWGPCDPAGPCGPVAPVSPFGPCGPVAPVSPFGPCEPVSPLGPVGPCGPTVNTGNKVTLRSLLPDTMVTVRVSGFQPELATATTTVCSPIERL